MSEELKKYNCSFEYVETLGYSCLFYNGIIIYKDINCLITPKELLEIAKKYHDSNLPTNR